MAFAARLAFFQSGTTLRVVTDPAYDSESRATFRGKVGTFSGGPDAGTLPRESRPIRAGEGILNFRTPASLGIEIPVHAKPGGCRSSSMLRFGNTGHGGQHFWFRVDFCGFQSPDTGVNVSFSVGLNQHNPYELGPFSPLAQTTAVQPTHSLMNCSELAARFQRFHPQSNALDIARMCSLIASNVGELDPLRDDENFLAAWDESSLRLQAATDQHAAVSLEMGELAELDPGQFTTDQVWVLIRAIKVQNQLLKLCLGTADTLPNNEPTS